MAVSLPGAPDEDPAADGPRPFDRSSLEQSLAEVLRAADPEVAPTRPVPVTAVPDALAIPTGLPVPPAPPEVSAGGAGRPDPFRSAGSVNHVGLRLPVPRPDTPAVPASSDPPAAPAVGATLATPGEGAAADPTGTALRSAAAIPPNLRLLSPPPDTGAGDRAGIADDGVVATGTEVQGSPDVRAAVIPWRPEDDDILPLRRGRRRRGR